MPVSLATGRSPAQPGGSPESETRPPAKTTAISTWVERYTPHHLPAASPATRTCRGGAPTTSQAPRSTSRSSAQHCWQWRSWPSAFWPDAQTPQREYARRPWRLLSPARFSWWSSGGAPCRNDLIVIESQTASSDGRSPSGLWRLSRTYGNLIANVRAAAPAGCVSLTIALARATASGRKLARIIIRRPVCRRRVDALMSRPRDRRP